MEKEINTHGFDAEAIIKEAREKGNIEFADLAQEVLKENPQVLYDVIADKHTCTEGENLWNISADFLRKNLK